jgi:hypothetical protein
MRKKIELENLGLGSNPIQYVNIAKCLDSDSGLVP